MSDSTEIDEQEVAGGAETFDGFKLVGSVTSDLDPGETETITFDDLKPQVRIHQMHGISAALNQARQNGNVGSVSLRVIHDTKMRAYLFRKDEDNVTIFKVSAGLNVS